MPAPAVSFGGDQCRDKNIYDLVAYGDTEALAAFNGGDEVGFQENRVETMYAKIPIRSRSTRRGARSQIARTRWRFPNFSGMRIAMPLQIKGEVEISISP